MVPVQRKERISLAFQNPLLRFLLRIGIHFTVPKNRIGVDLACINDYGQVLLLKHVFHPNTPWGLPGGWLERGEDPQACALRELEEEIGLTAEIGPAIYLSREPYPDHIGFAFLARLNSGNMELSSEIIEAKFFPNSELPDPLTPFTHKAIDAAQNAHKIPTKMENLIHE